MKILALDTSTEACSAALRMHERVHARYHEAPRGHAELILPMVDQLLAEANILLKDLDAIAFGRGPGSFTGVRLAASVVQGLAFGSGVGVVPVSTLQAVARRALLADAEATHVLVCNDARMDEVYTAAYVRESVALGPVALGPVALGPERVVPPAAVQLPSSAHGSAVGMPPRWIGAGRGFRAYADLGRLRQEQGGALAAVHDDLLPRAIEILELALPEVAAGRVLPAARALPVYVRDEVAKVPRSAV